MLRDALKNIIEIGDRIFFSTKHFSFLGTVDRITKKTVFYTGTYTYHGNFNPLDSNGRTTVPTKLLCIDKVKQNKADIPKFTIPGYTVKNNSL